MSFLRPGDIEHVWPSWGHIRQIAGTAAPDTAHARRIIKANIEKEIEKMRDLL